MAKRYVCEAGHEDPPIRETQTAKISRISLLRGAQYQPSSEWRIDHIDRAHERLGPAKACAFGVERHNDGSVKKEGETCECLTHSQNECGKHLVVARG
jgi:hypothetical protein